MAVVISNRGRLISDLTQATLLNNNDLLIIQSINATTNSTRKITLSQLSDKVLGSLNPYGNTVKFTNASNEFTGAFYNPNGYTSNLYALTIRNSVTMTSGTATISPNSLTFSPSGGALLPQRLQIQ